MDFLIDCLESTVRASPVRERKKAGIQAGSTLSRLAVGALRDSEIILFPSLRLTRRAPPETFLDSIPISPQFSPTNSWRPVAGSVFAPRHSYLPRPLCQESSSLGGLNRAPSPRRPKHFCEGDEANYLG